MCHGCTGGAEQPDCIVSHIATCPLIPSAALLTASLGTAGPEGCTAAGSDSACLASKQVCATTSTVAARYRCSDFNVDGTSRSDYMSTDFSWHLTCARALCQHCTHLLYVSPRVTSHT